MILQKCVVCCHCFLPPSRCHVRDYRRGCDCDLGCDCDFGCDLDRDCCCDCDCDEANERNVPRPVHAPWHSTKKVL